MSPIAYELLITGIVQGVGFRPFIYNLAESFSLKGKVINSGADVVIEVEGKKEDVEGFVKTIKSNTPPLAKIRDINIKQVSFKGYTNFIIDASRNNLSKSIYISPDAGMCSDCEKELLDPNNRRFLYPFINCTNCGPRFTIIKGVPYDRPLTTMVKFEMCPECRSEYMDPSNRRYHAEPVSCYKCGPKLKLTDNKGSTLETSDIINQVQKLIESGSIIAVKGIGGYHLVCDAKNSEAIVSLRKRKARDEKPFALMAKDYSTANKYCYIDSFEKELLESEKKPIVLLKKRPGINLPDEIAPGNPYLGVMLPYTPLHTLIFNNQTDITGFDIIIATSGNRSSEPIYYKDDNIVAELSGIADYFLTNDREIHIRTDDSVTRVFQGKEYIIRRSRGYVPFPVICDTGNDGKAPQVLALGGELKNTFCLNRGNEFFISHHIGDLENTETLDSFVEGIEHFKNMFGIIPEAVAYDLHPEYLSSKYAEDLDMKIKLQIQHHKAHIASCMADNNLSGKVIGVAFDGTGYGEDGKLWGGEFFTGDYNNFKREAHLQYVKMPGGEKAIKEPWRMALSYIYNIYGQNIDLEKIIRLFPGIDTVSIGIVIKMLEKNINSPETSSMGRLFDAAAAIIGIKSRISYEGQAAIELENIADKKEYQAYTYGIDSIDGVFSICTNDVIKSIIEDMFSGIPASVISSRFHSTMSNMIIKTCELLRESTGLNRVVLSGGVFQNITLLESSVKGLEKKKFIVYKHERVPANDGGICLGQAAIAAARLKR